MGEKPFENIVGKGGNAGNHHFLLFPQTVPAREVFLKKNIVGKEENAGNQHFLLFPQYFQPSQRKFARFEQYWNCRLQILSIWTGIKLCPLVSIIITGLNLKSHTAYSSSGNHPGGSVVSVSDSWPGGCGFETQLRRNFFPAYFSLSPKLKHVKKVDGGFGKKSCFSTGVRKPGNTCASPTAIIWP